MPTDGPSPRQRARRRQAMKSQSGDGGSSRQSLADRIRRTREKVQRTEQSKRADKRAKARKERMGDGESGGQSQTVQEAKALAGDAKQLIQTEFGISEEQAKSIISQGSELLASAGGQLDRLDADGDGDTDILQRVEAGVEQQRRDQQRQQQGPVEQIEPPVGEVEDDFTELGTEGVEAELGLDAPIEDSMTGPFEK